MHLELSDNELRKRISTGACIRGRISGIRKLLVRV